MSVPMSRSTSGSVRDARPEVNLLYIAGLLALILGGAGRLSVDRAVRRWVRERRGRGLRRPQHA